ncbi:MAG: PHP domain-containing protein [Chloroflexota bacterium]
MGLADLHVHTIYSYDGTAPVPSVLRRAREVGLDVIAVTDHDVIEGALRALDLAPKYGVEVIPGIEITTAEGDLLALFVHETIQAGRSLVETVLNVRELGGICIAPHPSARGMGMKSLSVKAIVKALRVPAVADTLIGIESYNATALDKVHISAARLLTSRMNLASVGNSDAHVLGAIGLGATEFPGQGAADLLSALRSGQTSVRRRGEWSQVRILASWVVHYVGSAFTRLVMAAQ